MGYEQQSLNNQYNTVGTSNPNTDSNSARHGDPITGNVTTLEGIQHFKNLEQLSVRNINPDEAFDLVSSDFLAGLTNLKSVYIHADGGFKDINTINFGNNPNLTQIVIYGEHRSGYGANSNPNPGGDIKHIDVTGLPNLTNLLMSTYQGCAAGTYCAYMDSSKGWGHAARLDELDVSKNPKLERLQVDSKFYSWSDDTPGTTEEVTGVGKAQISKLDLTSNPNLRYLYMSGLTNLTTLDLSSQATFAELYCMECYGLQSIDLTGLSQTETFGTIDFRGANDAVLNFPENPIRGGKFTYPSRYTAYSNINLGSTFSTSGFSRWAQLLQDVPVSYSRGEIYLGALVPAEFRDRVYPMAPSDVFEYDTTTGTITFKEGYSIDSYIYNHDLAQDKNNVLYQYIVNSKTGQVGDPQADGYQYGLTVFIDSVVDVDAPVTTDLAGKVSLTGDTLAKDQFSFELVDENGNVVEIVTNDANGAITFKTLSHTTAGTHTYTVRQVAGSAEGFAYDPTEHQVVVNVTEKRDPTTNVPSLDKEVTVNGQPYTADSISFTNTYTAPAPAPSEDPQTPETPKKLAATGDPIATLLPFLLLGVGASTLVVVVYLRRYKLGQYK